MIGPAHDVPPAGRVAVQTLAVLLAVLLAAYLLTLAV